MKEEVMISEEVYQKLVYTEDRRNLSGSFGIHEYVFRNDEKDNRDASSNETVPLLPLRELIVFPHEVYPIFVGRQKSIKAVGGC
jgi:hypothetical protein